MLDNSGPVQCLKRGLCMRAYEHVKLSEHSRASTKSDAPVGGTGFHAQELGLQGEAEESGPRSDPARWLTKPCVCTCHSRPGGSRLPGDPSPPPHCRE